MCSTSTATVSSQICFQRGRHLQDTLRVQDLRRSCAEGLLAQSFPLVQPIRGWSIRVPSVASDSGFGPNVSATVTAQPGPKSNTTTYPRLVSEVAPPATSCFRSRRLNRYPCCLRFHQLVDDWHGAAEEGGLAVLIPEIHKHSIRVLEGKRASGIGTPGSRNTEGRL